MSEFIMEFDGLTAAMFQSYLGEEIVRCRDCRHWQPWMKGAEPECWANGEPFSTPPEGFCAWGERREK